MSTIERIWLWVGGFALTALGSAVMYGWVVRSAELTQIHPNFVPMQFNTALGFALLGLALIGAVAETPWITRTLAAAVLLVGTGTGLEYVAGADFGIDTLFMDPYTVTKTSHPGRMAPNTALCFALAGLALLLLRGGPKLTAMAAYRCGGPGLAVLGLGFIAAVGYAAGIETTYGWGRLTRMALHTSLGFIAAGTLLCIPAWIRWNALGPARLVPGSAAVGITLLVVSLWTVLEAENNQKLGDWGRTEISTAIANIATALERDRLALERMAARFDNDIVNSRSEWIFDARSYLDDMPALEFLQLESGPDIHWEWPDHNEKRLHADSPRPGKFLIETPLSFKGPGRLIAKLDGSLFIEDSLDESVPIAGYRVEYDGRVIAERRPELQPIMEIRMSEDRLIGTTPLTVEMVLDYIRLRRMSSAAPTAALLVGLALAALVTVLLILYYRERAKTAYESALVKNLSRSRVGRGARRP